MQDHATTLGRRHLKCFASGTAHMFSCSAVHYAWLAHHYGIRRVTIDLLTLTIEPTEFNIKRNRILAEMCRASLLRNLAKLTPPATCTSALLVADFGIEDHSVRGRSEWIGKTTFSVSLVDDRGKEWCCRLVSETFLAQGDGFGDPDR